MASWRIGGLIGVWCLCAAAGLGALLLYASTPAQQTIAPRQWPASSAMSRAANRPTLVMFVHPFCPCSRASLSELNVLATRCQGRVALRIVFVWPKDLPRGDDSSLYSDAQTIPDAVVSIDEDSVEADRFEATTSGETLLYAVDGRLLFQGGLTWARGHEGDNAGREAVISWIETNRAPLSSTPVFGCALFRRCCPVEAEEPLCTE
jgi:hypothetical protein